MSSIYHAIFSISLSVIETVHLIKDADQHLSSNIQNGKINRKCTKDLSRKSVIAYKEKETELDADFPTLFWTQFSTIFLMMMLQIKRNKLKIYVQIVYHAYMALSLGCFYYNVGNNASYAMFNVKFCLCTMIFYVFGYAIPTVLLCKHNLNTSITCQKKRFSLF